MPMNIEIIGNTLILTISKIKQLAGVPDLRVVGGVYSFRIDTSA